ncbi:neurotrypsin-like [Antedon mediterranea]|uniref:neurotrypsin-like n=1 Tax=Antedon mediterranea TaxID=105859 RepID=UPI003AF7616D
MNLDCRRTAKVFSLPWLFCWFCLMRWYAESAVAEYFQNPLVALTQGTSDLNGYLIMRLAPDTEWISVCKQSWAGSYNENAAVACRQLDLGLPKKNMHWNSSLLEAPSSSTQFACIGNEDSLLQCPYISITNCSNDNRLWLECSGFDEIKLRLTGGAHFEQGRVEIYHDGEWGTICDRDWTMADANIVCKTYLNSQAINAYKSMQDNNDVERPIFIEDISCTGMEKNILDCAFKGLEETHDCSHTDEVWADCEINIVISGGQSVSASLITALSIIVLVFLLVVEYFGLRRYQRWKAERRARRQNVNVRFQPLDRSASQSMQDQLNVGGTVDFHQVMGDDYPSNRTSSLPSANQSLYSNNLLLIPTTQIIDEPPPPYTFVAQNGTSIVNENYGQSSTDPHSSNSK